MTGWFFGKVNKFLQVINLFANIENYVMEVMMKILDGHIHIFDCPLAPFDKLAEEMWIAGISGGVIISQPPSSFPEFAAPCHFSERIDNVLEWQCASGLEFYPFFWIDPTDEDAEIQIETAVKRGVSGFKMICDHFYPEDVRVMDACRQIAESDRSVLFHSGILFDGKASSVYNRPAGFEALADVPRLRFALSHLSWPWVDEHIAVYGKFANSKSRKKNMTSEMFVDTTRGTPEIYREEALRKLYTTGYNVTGNTFFGSDRIVDNFKNNGAAKGDMEILRKIGLNNEQMEAYFYKNLLRFIFGDN
jgi:predicted TIM-barrel fold metal-dependent hydrolase